MHMVWFLDGKLHKQGMELWTTDGIEEAMHRVCFTRGRQANEPSLLRGSLRQGVLDYTQAYQNARARNFDKETLKMVKEKAFKLTWETEGGLREMMFEVFAANRMPLRPPVLYCVSTAYMLVTDRGELNLDRMATYMLVDEIVDSIKPNARRVYTMRMCEYVQEVAMRMGRR